MAEVKTRNVSFPRYAEYNCAFKYIVEQALRSEEHTSELQSPAN